jgi:hypothetical protein
LHNYFKMYNIKTLQILIESIVVAVPLFMIIRTIIQKGKNLLDD